MKPADAAADERSTPVRHLLVSDVDDTLLGDDEALAEFRRFNYERIYMRPASVAQADQVIRVLQALVEHFADRPNRLPLDGIEPDHRPGVDAGSPEAQREAVAYVGGMTDRFAFSTAIAELGWDPERVPRGIDVRR